MLVDLYGPLINFKRFLLMNFPPSILLMYGYPVCATLSVLH